MNADTLKHLGILPVFYPITENSDGKENHDALRQLIQELASDLDTPGIPPPLHRTTRHLLER